MTPQEKLQKCYESFKQKIDFVPEVALILGSGLGALADEIDIKAVLDYRDIDGFPQSTVPGHKGRFVFGYMDGVPVVIMQGRVHYYEGYQMQDVVLPTRLMKLMGAKILILTNASGGINENFSPGDFMLITDHISSLVPNPLVGENIGELGVRFPDMSEVYNHELNDKIRASAKALGIDLKEGVYIQTTGPSYESPAEIRMFKSLGADAVGMSTVVEAIAANHAGMKICGISCVTNLAAGIAKYKLTEEEVLEAGAAAAPRFKELLIKSIGEF